MTISKTEGERYTHRVTATENADKLIVIREGEKRKGTREHFDETVVFLTREEIARIAQYFPIKKEPAQ